MSHPVCPRCEGYIPSNLTPGRYPGALSRTDNVTEICSDCGREEATHMLVYKSIWPVNTKPGFDSAMQRCSERLIMESTAESQ